jgi:hypothetical protein
MILPITVKPLSTTSIINNNEGGERETGEKGKRIIYLRWPLQRFVGNVQKLDKERDERWEGIASGCVGTDKYRLGKWELINR